MLCVVSRTVDFVSFSAVRVNRFLMPAQKFVDKHSLKILNMEPTGIPQNNSHQHLMNDDDVDSAVPPLTSSNLSDPSGAKRTNVETGITKRQIVTVVILCFVNLINYMDRYTIAGKRQVCKHNLNYFFET